MPSYNLVRKMNLGDVDSTEEARKNLRIGPFVVQDSNNVNITGGTIAVDSLAINPNYPSHEPTPGLSGAYVISKDDQGTLGWDHYFPASSWATDYASNISIAAFSNDMNLVNRSTLCNVSFYGRFSDLEDEPTIHDVIPVSVAPYLLRSDRNLQEFVADDGSFDSNILIDLFELKSLAFKTYENTTVRDVTVFENFYIFGNCNQIDSLLQSKAYQSVDGLFNTVDTDWYNPFYDEEHYPRDIVLLIDSYSNNSTTSSTTAIALSNMYVNLEQVREINQGNFDHELVKATMINRMQSGEFISSVSNFSEPSLNSNLCKQNLGLGTIGDLANQNSLHTTTLSISTSITHNNTIANSIGGGIYICQDNLGTMIPTSLPHATEINSGVVRFSSNLFSSNVDHEDHSLSNCVVNSATLFNMYTTFASNVTYLGTIAYSNLSEFDNPENLVFLDNRLSQFANQPLLQFDAYSNLELAPISYDDNYYRLNAYPTTLHTFQNDIGALLKHNNLAEVEQEHQIAYQTVLGLGTMAVENRDGTTILNGTADLSHARATSMRFLKLSSQLSSRSNTWMSCPQGQDQSSSNAMLSELRHATETVRGLVKVLDTYSVASYDEVVAAQSVKDMHDYFMSRLTTIEDRLNAYGVPIQFL